MCVPCSLKTSLKSLFYFVDEIGGYKEHDASVSSADEGDEHLGDQIMSLKIN